MAKTSTSWRVDIAIIGPGEAHMVRIDDADGIADMCALIAYLRERRGVQAAEPTLPTDTDRGDSDWSTACRSEPVEHSRRRMRF